MAYNQKYSLSETPYYKPGQLLQLKYARPQNEHEITSTRASFCIVSPEQGNVVSFPSPLIEFWKTNGPDSPVMYLGHKTVRTINDINKDVIQHHFLYGKTVAVVTAYKNNFSLGWIKKEALSELHAGIDWANWNPNDITPWFKACEMKQQTMKTK